MESRRPHLGRVLGPDGAPVPNASVTFLGSGDGLGSSADVARAVTRDNGRFRVALLPGRDYRAYAIAPPGTLLQASPVVSQFMDLGVPVTEISFAADEVVVPSETIKIHGFDRWRDLGEMRVQVWLDGCRQELEDQVVGSDGLVRVPPMPPAELEAFVFVGGQMVHASRATRVISMPRPFVVRGHVVDADGRAISGAKIQRVYNRQGHRCALTSRDAVRRFEVATTDQDGRAEWWLAADQDPFVESWTPRTFVASAEGFRGCVAGFTRAVLSDHEIVSSQVQDRTLPFVLQRAEPVSISFPQDVGASGVSWAVHYQMHSDKSSYQTQYDVGFGQVVSGGGATIMPWPRGAKEPRVFLLGVIPRLAAGHPFARAVAPWPLEVPLTDPVGMRVEAPLVVPVCIRVMNATGGPASGVDVGLFSLDRGLKEPFAVPAATDTAGRLVLPASPGRYLLVALGSREWLKQEFEVAAEMDPLELRLAPIPQMRLRVVDVDGRPLEGVRVGSNSSSTPSVTDPLESVLQEVARSFHSRYFSTLESDREGRMHLPFIPVASRKVSFRLETFGRTDPPLASKRLSLTETENLEDVVLRK